MNKDEMYVTLLGTPATGWATPVKIGQVVCLVKEPENRYDSEALMVKDNTRKHIGYVANSTRTVLRGTLSAGRLYDKIPECIKAKVLFIVGEVAIAKITEC